MKEQMKKSFGLPKLRYAGCASGTLSTSLIEWFDGLDVDIQQIYTLSECTGNDYHSLIE